MNFPTPEQEAAWKRELDENLSAGIFRPRTDEPMATHEPGDPIRLATALGAVLARLASGQGVSLGSEPRDVTRHTTEPERAQMEGGA